MTVLGEPAIKAHMNSGALIKGGDPKLVRGCSYSCRAAKVFLGGAGDQGSQPTILDWTIPKPTDVYRVQPRQLVWLRIRETVALPDNICAFWWQTNSLSRKGLMLVNMSMVDPGYEGELACLFVNFGREPVDIDPGMTVARLVFHQLDGRVPPFGRGLPLAEYDRELRAVALSGPSSFLSLHEFSAAFQEEKRKALEDFERDSSTKADAIFRNKTEDLPKFLRSAFGYAVAGFVILTAAMAAASWFLEHVNLDLDKRVDSAVEEEISKRLPPATILDSATAKEIEQRLSDLQTQIQTTRAQIQNRQSKK